MTRDYRIRFVLIVTLIGVISSGLALAADSPIIDRILSNGVLKVGMSGNQAPMNARNNDDQLIGLEVDLANMLAAAMEVKVEFVIKPFPELLPALKSGEVDIVMSGMTITAKRSADVSFVGPYMLSGKSILTKSDLLAAADEAGDINEEHLTVTALKDSTSETFVNQYLPKVTLVTSDDYDKAVKMVIDGQADVLVADMPVCVTSVLKYPEADLVTLTRPLTVEPFGIAIPATDAQFLNLLENYLKTLEAMEVLDDLKRKWLDNGAWVSTIP
jgi:polar amino acid transport system substrate-binding protein